MHRWSAAAQIPEDFGPSVVTLGNFDGVHRGHRAVLARVVDAAADLDLRSAAVTFDPHPVAVLRPDTAPGLLTSPAHRLDLLASTGLDAVLVMEFTRELATWTPEEFVSRIFVDRLQARLVVVGADTRFGVRNSGDTDTLRDLGAAYGFDVEVVHDVGHADNGRARWSSTQVRGLLIEGDVALAAEVLGRPHAVSGVVVHGHHRGRDLGYPTANLAQDSEGFVPADGVYAGWLVRPGRAYDDPERRLPAAISVGTNPTFDGVERTVEAYVLGRDDLDLYDEWVVVEFVDHVRPMLRFDSIDALIAQMADDVESCRAILDR